MTEMNEECKVQTGYWTAIVELHCTRPDWKKRRKTGIGASEVAAILGCGYASSSLVTVWASKTGGLEVEFDEATLKRMNRGKRLEPYIAMEFSEETGLNVMNPGDYTIYRSAENPWLFATLDRICFHPDFGVVPVELKAVNGRFRSEWNEDEEPPLKYMVQCQTQMAVTGATHCYLVGLVGGDELVIRLIERNQRFIDAMIIKLQEFWGFVERKEMPPVDESEATKAMLGLIYPHDSGDAVELHTEFVELDRELIELKDKRKQIETRINGIENQIKAAIGDASKGLFPSGSYSWKQQSRRGIDADLLRANYPDIAIECEKCSTFRVLRRSSK